mmetsp:Transcript_8822/g.14655  ORF Transcript_8822/g.14655 Transcript_8822/m.14655 type:complete len:216 (-) Transcript_8822:536-1183(-)
MNLSTVGGDGEEKQAFFVLVVSVTIHAIHNGMNIHQPHRKRVNLLEARISASCSSPHQTGMHNDGSIAITRANIHLHRLTSPIIVYWIRRWYVVQHWNSFLGSLLDEIDSKLFVEIRSLSLFDSRVSTKCVVKHGGVAIASKNLHKIVSDVLDSSLSEFFLFHFWNCSRLLQLLFLHRPFCLIIGFGLHQFNHVRILLLHLFFIERFVERLVELG